MRLILLTAGAALALASTPAMAQLAGAGNLVSTSASPPTGASAPNHQSTTMVAAGGGTRGAIYGVSGGDALPGVDKGDIIAAPGAVGSNTKNRSAAAYVQLGAQNGVTARAAANNSLGAGPNGTFRSADVNTGSLGSATGSGNAAGGNALSNVTGRLTGK